MKPDRAAWTKRYSGIDVRTLADVPTKPRQKYGARPLDLDGLHFDSTKEARRYRDLCVMLAAGEISKLEIHPTYTIDVIPLSVALAGGRVTIDALVFVGMYTPDFRYVDAAGALVVEDVKSKHTKTDAYRLRKRLVEAIYGITITEI